MRLFAVAVRDVKMDSYSNPFFVPTLGVAERSFADEVNRPDSTMRAHTEDYSLYHVGYFEVEAGMLVPLESAPVLLCTAVAVSKAAV